MEMKDGKTYLPCWRDKDKALQFLKAKFGDDERFGVVPSTDELVQQTMMRKVHATIELRFMD